MVNLNRGSCCHGDGRLHPTTMETKVKKLMLRLEVTWHIFVLFCFKKRERSLVFQSVFFLFFFFKARWVVRKIPIRKRWDNEMGQREVCRALHLIFLLVSRMNGDGKGRTDPGWISRIAVRIVYWLFYHKSKRWGLALLPFSGCVSSTPLGQRLGT